MFCRSRYAGVCRHGRQRLVGGDLRRDVPERAHDDVRHALAEDRRLVARLADDGTDVEDDPSLLVRLEVKVRDVDAEVARAEVVGQPPPAFEVECDLTEARRKRHVEGGDRSGIEPSGRGQAVMFLEDAHGADKRLVVPVALDRCRAEIARSREPLAQRDHAGMRRARCESRGAKSRPATLGFHALQRGQGTHHRDVLGVRRLNRRQPLAHVLSAGGQRGGKIRPATLGLPAAVHRAGIEPARCDIAAQPNQRGREAQVEDRQRVRPLRRGLAGHHVTLRCQRGQLIRLGVEPVRPGRGEHSQRAIGLRGRCVSDSRRGSCPSGRRRPGPRPGRWHRRPADPACRRPAATGARATVLFRAGTRQGR